MTKYALIVASLLALTACQSGGGRGTSQTSTETGVTGSAAGTTETTAPPSGSTGNESAATSSQSGISTQGSSSSQETATSNANPGAPVYGATGQTTPSTDATESAKSPAKETSGQEADTAQGTASPGQSGSASGTQANKLDSSILGGADQALSNSITNALSAQGFSPQALSKIQLRTINGRVIITGTVGSEAEKQRVETQVRQTPGVQMVVNNLRVQSGMEQPGESPSPNSNPGTASPNPQTGAAPGPQQ